MQTEVCTVITLFHWTRLTVYLVWFSKTDCALISSRFCGTSPPVVIYSLNLSRYSLAQGNVIIVRSRY